MAAVSLGTGAASTDADFRILQNINGILGGHAGNGKGYNVGSLVSTGDDHSGIVQYFEQLADIQVKRPEA